MWSRGSQHQLVQVNEGTTVVLRVTYQVYAGLTIFGKSFIGRITHILSSNVIPSFTLFTHYSFAIPCYLFLTGTTQVYIRSRQGATGFWLDGFSWAVNTRGCSIVNIGISGDCCLRVTHVGWRMVQWFLTTCRLMRNVDLSPLTT